jgi:hypothetical protein
MLQTAYWFTTMPPIIHPTKPDLRGRSDEYETHSIKGRQNSEKARQNGTHPDEKNSSFILRTPKERFRVLMWSIKKWLRSQYLRFRADKLETIRTRQKSLPRYQHNQHISVVHNNNILRWLHPHPSTSLSMDLLPILNNSQILEGPFRHRYAAKSEPISRKHTITEGVGSHGPGSNEQAIKWWQGEWGV